MSSHVVTLFKTQVSRSSTYLGHECEPNVFYCVDRTVPCGYTGSIQDMIVGEHSCGWGCLPQNVCLRPDKSEAYIGLSSNGRDPLVVLTWDVTPPNLKCVYNLNNIDTLSQINALKRLFPPDQFNHAIRSFCTKPSNNCPSDLNSCSRLKAADEFGSICREWMSSLSSDNMRDSVKREYCLTHDTDDCKCINRAKQPDFIALRNGMDAQTLESTRCWYKPCETNSNLLLDIEQKQECVANVCQNIINAHARGNIDIRNNTSSLNCSFTKQEMDKANAVRDKILNPPKPQPDIKPDYKPSSSWLNVSIKVSGLICIVVILMFVVRKYFMRKRYAFSK